MSSKPAVLVVDDQPANRIALEALLDDFDIQLLQAASGEEALKLLDNHDVAVVLLDMATPMSCFWAATCFGVARATDYLDGWLARKLKLVSMTGKFLDPLADKLMVMACSVQLAAMGWLSPWIPILLLSRELAVQGLRQIASAEGMDDDRPALIRETTTRDGDRLVTLKEVDFTDDAADEWLQRNRTVLERVAD